MQMLHLRVALMILNPKYLCKSWPLVEAVAADLLCFTWHLLNIPKTQSLPSPTKRAKYHSRSNQEKVACLTNLKFVFQRKSLKGTSSLLNISS